MNGYDIACEAVVLDILIAFPARLAPIHIFFIELWLECFKESKNELNVYFRDLIANFTLAFVDLIEIKDSIDCAIASKPEDALFFFGNLETNSLIKKNLSGINNLFSTEYLILLI